MVSKIFSPKLIFSHGKLIPIILILAVLVSGCTTDQTNTPAVNQVETSQDAVEDVSSPVLQELEAVEAQNSGDDEAHLFSSNQLGICFSYPQGYIQNPNVETVSISAPFLPGAGDTSGYFWLEISDPYDRSALRIADEDMTLAISVGIPRENIGWWSITLGGEEAVVLDGMPGQNFQRRVYVVHDENLYVLGFWPARSENKEIGEQMEALYTAVTRSWSWSPCSGGE